MIDQTDASIFLPGEGESLLRSARKIRGDSTGERLTYSPKVFIPLTMLCRDHCHYCTFAQPPTRLDAPFLSMEQILQIAGEGAQAGCHEALFTLGERPELRFEQAQQWLRTNGYDSTIHYLHDACEAVVEETGLLPHTNAGALYLDELAELRQVSASQGMMIESLNPNLACHRGSPDKAPERRIQTLEAAGTLNIPFTTGILVGIGESRRDRVEALLAIARIHQRYGHVQEVIVQNFLPKPRTGMQAHPPCGPGEFLDAIALARNVLPPEIHVQAPPNLSDGFGKLLEAGLDDWGGISPVTADHVNPERPWPPIGRLREVAEARGFVLAPRLTIYPSFALEPDTWLDKRMHFPVLDRMDAEGLARDDPGAVFPQRVEEITNVGDGAEVRLVGRRSTAWYSGSNTVPPTLVPAAPSVSGHIAEILSGIALRQEAGEDELLALFAARGPEVAAIARFADQLRCSAVGDTVTFVRTRNINYTNVCTFKCRFCAFSKGRLSLNLRGTPYLLTLDDITTRAQEAWDQGATEVCLQGGIHPNFDGNYYIDVCRAVKEAVPEIHIHGFTALEVTEGARRLDESLESYLHRLKDAGLRSLPGTAAEILDDPVREVLCPDKITTEEWLECHRVAHEVGLRSNVTMMFGSIEQPISWVRHLLRTRQLQKQTRGFTEFVGLPFVHMAAPLFLQRQSRRGPTFRETLLVHAIARIAYHQTISNIQVSWVKIGFDGARQLLQAGVNDLGGTLMNENISRAAGAAHGQMATDEDFARVVRPLGRPLAERTTLYETLPFILSPR